MIYFIRDGEYVKRCPTEEDKKLNRISEVIWNESIQKIENQ